MSTEAATAATPARFAGSWSELFRGGTGLLVVGLLLMEFATAMQYFAVAVVMPLVAHDLHAERSYGWLLGSYGMAMIAAAPLTPAITARLGRLRTAGVASVVFVVGGVLAAVAGSAVLFVVARLFQGFGSGVLTTFGVSAVAHSIPERLRKRVYSLISAMWLLPAFLGPVYASTVSDLLGWRWTLTLILPLVVVGRALVVRRAGAMRQEAAQGVEGVEKDSAVRTPPFIRVLILIGGCLLLLGGTSVKSGVGQIVAVCGLLVVAVAARKLLPSGERGPRLAVLAMLTLSLGYSGLDAMATVIARSGFGSSIAAASAVLTCDAVAWSTVAFLQPKFHERWNLSTGAAGVVGALLVAVPVAGMPVMLAAHLSSGTAMPLMWVAFLISGSGMGFIYTNLPVTAVDVRDKSTTDAFAAGLVLAESMGASLGSMIGGGLYAYGLQRGLSAWHSLSVAVGALSVSLFATVFIAVAIQRHLRLRG
ncbi:major facilitator superfamily MFS_1 [Catenulispora acidiphila DSM 44928]|uniref:Major facilitator superfamily MFS_1 n=1 Tax=Catenulispora acidiphila (strain DSM 44928 / JCM 14897 / NBRC 102108 / NRRL B-24433 / ID139908) TaxID=479433 RepID=C7Q7L1_CATAD|nr:MFS transporter [Catenulispora acidiphila]ACU72204.1 major facilitator superfamily MFS_1 [Catenulispora acidiphila DSM 44928]